jgi:hypothetical protein
MGDECARCQGERWICETHPDRPCPHDDCPGRGDPCPICNTKEPPAMRPDFRSFIPGEKGGASWKSHGHL